MYVRIKNSAQIRQAGRHRRQLTYYRDLVRELVVRELKVLYKRSALGVAWTLINPLLQLAVFSVVFKVVLKAGDGIENYLSYAFSGLLIWGWTQSSLFQATGLITGNPALIRQPGFPVAILPIVTVTTGLVHFLLALPALLGIMFYEQVSWSNTCFALPVLLLLQFILTVSFAYPLAAMNVKFRDTQHTLGVILQLMFYLLPIFYAVEVTGSNLPTWILQIYRWNPMVALIEAYRDILLRGVLPNWGSLLLLVISGALLLPIGYQIFKRERARFVEEI
ncbi:ABC transporter permease [filamentous cyanobacterium LEGE 11480]|uniref:Transport permease protein n=1 Tax=Romeriopsis navalis LEGE 11480 TaxID=2777977 RepID=A0A928VPV6_9CYAN|nr:ABC transporter permease [Romeriopsis navalis]MBE9030716.1 ABC transporter permease [Romeriopsis navalis LEGE 11480]